MKRNLFLLVCTVVMLFLPAVVTAPGGGAYLSLSDKRALLHPISYINAYHDLMRHTVGTYSLGQSASTTDTKIYVWHDHHGTVHISDQPRAQDKPATTYTVSPEQQVTLYARSEIYLAMLGVWVTAFALLYFVSWLLPLCLENALRKRRPKRELLEDDSNISDKPGRPTTLPNISYKDLPKTVLNAAEKAASGKFRAV